MERRERFAGRDCTVADCPLGQRHLDDTECDRDREHNHHDEQEAVPDRAGQVPVRAARGKCRRRRLAAGRSAS